MNFETFDYKGSTFTVWEYDNYFLVIVDDETHKLDSLADVHEFIQYYKYYA